MSSEVLVDDIVRDFDDDVVELTIIKDKGKMQVVWYYIFGSKYVWNLKFEASPRHLSEEKHS